MHQVHAIIEAENQAIIRVFDVVDGLIPVTPPYGSGRDSERFSRMFGILQKDRLFSHFHPRIGFLGAIVVGPVMSFDDDFNHMNHGVSIIDFLFHESVLLFYRWCDWHECQVEKFVLDFLPNEQLYQ